MPHPFDLANLVADDHRLAERVFLRAEPGRGNRRQALFDLIVFSIDVHAGEGRAGLLPRPSQGGVVLRRRREPGVAAWAVGRGLPRRAAPVAEPRLYGPPSSLPASAAASLLTALTGFLNWRTTVSGPRVRRSPAQAWTMLKMTALVLVDGALRVLP